LKDLKYTILIEGATISIARKAKRHNYILGGTTIFFGGATIGDATKMQTISGATITSGATILIDITSGATIFNRRRNHIGSMQN
jgi:hypothetical protein